MRPMILHWGLGEVNASFCGQHQSDLADDSALEFLREALPVAALVGDLACDAPLADQKALEVERIKQYRDGRDLIALACYFFLAENDAQFGGKRADHVDFALAAATRATHRFTVDRDGAAQRSYHASDPASKHRLELFQFKNPKYT